MVPLRGSGFFVRFFGTLKNGANSTMAGYSKPQPITDKFVVLHTGFSQSQLSKYKTNNQTDLLQMVKTEVSFYSLLAYF